MKPLLIKVSNEVIHSFNIRQEKSPNINSRWHHHPELELIYFHKGSGTQFVGDSIKRFRPGDIVLIGKNLPHCWKYDENDLQFIAGPYATVIHFFDNFWGEQFLNLPENNIIKTILTNANRGLQVPRKLEVQVKELMNSILYAEGPKRIMLLIEILSVIGNCSEVKAISSMGFKPNYEESDRHLINLIYDYSFANFKNKISLEEIAGIAKISPNSFCRHFKSRTGKTYSQFVNEIRVGYACKLLIENKINIKQICYESGFSNFTSFHTFFKSITGRSPLNYQHKFINKPD